jgi:hypothetical protein
VSAGLLLGVFARIRGIQCWDRFAGGGGKDSDSRRLSSAAIFLAGGLGAREVGRGSLEKRCLHCERPAFRISLRHNQ